MPASRVCTSRVRPSPPGCTTRASATGATSTSCCRPAGWIGPSRCCWPRASPTATRDCAGAPARTTRSRCGTTRRARPTHGSAGEVDVHHRFPGIEDDPERAFAELWRRREPARLAASTSGSPTSPAARLSWPPSTSRATRTGSRPRRTCAGCWRPRVDADWAAPSRSRDALTPCEALRAGIELDPAGRRPGRAHRAGRRRGLGRVAAARPGVEPDRHPHRGAAGLGPSPRSARWPVGRAITRGHPDARPVVRRTAPGDSSGRTPPATGDGVRRPASVGGASSGRRVASGDAPSRDRLSDVLGRPSTSVREPGSNARPDTYADVVDSGSPEGSCTATPQESCRWPRPSTPVIRFGMAADAARRSRRATRRLGGADLWRARGRRVAAGRALTRLGCAYLADGVTVLLRRPRGVSSPSTGSPWGQRCCLGDAFLGGAEDDWPVRASTSGRCAAHRAAGDRLVPSCTGPPRDRPHVEDCPRARWPTSSACRCLRARRRDGRSAPGAVPLGTTRPWLPDPLSGSRARGRGGAPPVADHLSLVPAAGRRRQRAGRRR